MRKSSSRARLFSTCLTGAVLIAAAPAWAQTSEAPTWKPRAEIEAEAGTTVGVSTKLWAPLAQNDSGLVYVDGRIGYDQRFERNGSATIGARARVNEDFAIGANAGIDFYRSDIGQRDQAAVSLGLEGFGPVFDVRVNYRMPITRKATISYIDPAAAPAGELLLENNRLIERRSGFRLEEIPLRGFNGEAGVRLPVGRNASLRASIGGFDYWDIRADESHRGARGGLELDVEDSGSGARFTFGGTVERDNRYGTDARATVRLSIPLGGARGDRGRALTGLDRQMGDRVRRDYVARSGSRFTDLSSDQFAIDARTGQAFGGFYYASGTGTAGAAGTLASPTTIGDAVTRAGANGVVVALGSGGTINTGGVTLATNQYLLGGAGAVDVRLGNGSVTSFALGGTNGTIAGTGAATPTITLGQGSVVRDVTVRGAGTGIAANGVGGFSIDRVVIENTGGAGLSLTNTLGSVALTGLTIRGGAGTGLLVDGGSSVSVTNSSISGGAGAVDINDGGANLAVSLSNLTLSATAGNVLDIDGSGAGTVTVTGLSGITIAGGQGEDGGLSVRSATFDASTTTAGIQTVNAGRMEVGTTAARVDGPGVFLTDVTGSLSFADLDVANRNATGVQVVNSKVNGFTLATLDGTIDALGGTAMDLDPLVIDLRFASVRSAGATGHGLILDSVQGGGTGGNALTIGTLTLTDSGGDGLVLVDSTGFVRVLGGSISNSGGSAVRVGTQGVAGSGGTIGLSFAGTITDPTGSAPLVGLFNAGGGIGFTGAINGSGGIVVQDSLAGSSVNFGNVTLTGTTGPAVLLDNLAGSVAFTGPLTIANPAGNGIVIGNVPGGVSFGSVAISGLGNAIGLDLAGTHGNVTFGSLAITGTGTGTGINLAGSTNAGNVLIGGAATIQGVTTGVDLTGADMSGMFRFGAGAGSGSMISAGTPLLIAGLNEGHGSYDFGGASLQGDTTNLTGHGFTAYYVLAGATGAGTRNDPGSLAGAEASGAKYIVLLNNAAGGQDVLDAASAGGSFDLTAGQTLVSFLAGDFFSVTGQPGLPANLIVTGLGPVGISNPFAGSGAALLTTTTAGAATVNLADNSVLAGLVIANATSVAVVGSGTSGVRIADSQIGGAGGAISIVDGGAAASVTLTNLDLSASGGTVLALGGAGAGTLSAATIDVDIVASGNAAGLALDTVNSAGIAIGSLSVANAAGDAVLIQGVSGTPVAIGGISVGGTAGDGVVIAGNSAAVAVGGVSVAGAAGDALRVTANSGPIAVGGVTAGTIAGNAVALDGNGGSVTIGGVSATGVGGVGLDIRNVQAGVTVGGATINGTSVGIAIDGVRAGTGVAIANLSVTGATGAGVTLTDVDGAVLFGTTSITSPGTTGIVFGAGSAGSITFGDTDITGLGAGSRGVDARAATGTITFQTLDIAGTSTAGTRGIDLTGANLTTNFVTTDSSNITGVGIGVDLTNATITGSFRYGDGSGTDADGAASSIVAVTPIVATGIAVATGSYDFRDVALTGDVSALTSSHSLYFVKAGATGAGTMADPGSLAGAEASTADTIILLNDPSGGADLLDAVSAGGSFDLGAGKTLLSFLGGDTLTLSGGAPANVLLYGVQQGQIANPYAGSGAPTLTTTAAGFDTLVLGGANLVQGVRIDNAGGGAGIFGAGVANVTIRGSNVAGQASAIHFIDNGATANLALADLLLSSAGGAVVDLDGTGGGTLAVTGLDNLTIAGGNGETAGFLATGVLFDSDLATAGAQAVTGALTIGTTAARVDGMGFSIDASDGSLDLSALTVANANDIGLGLAPDTDLTVVVRSGAIDTSGSDALLSFGTKLALSLGSITATDGGIALLGTSAADTAQPVLNVGTLNLTDGGLILVGSGDHVIAGGSITDTVGIAVLLGDAANLDFAGDISSSGGVAATLVAIAHTGTATFHDGTIDVTAGNGFQFVDADGDYTFSGTTALHGGDARINVANDSAGNFLFGAGTSVADGAVANFVLQDSSANVTYLGSLSQSLATDNFVAFNQSGGTLDFSQATISASAGSGMLFIDADGTNRFGDVALSGGAGLAVFADSAGTLSFGNVDVTGIGAAQTAVDLTGAVGNVSFQTLDIAGNSAAGSTGIDLSGSTTAANIVVAESSTMTGLDVGVDLTGAAITGTFRYGDGSNTDLDGAASSINAATPLVIAGLNGVTGTYDFADVALTGDTTALQTDKTVFWVQAGATGAGTRADPGSLVAAEASGADVIVLLDTQSAGQDVINGAGAGGGLDLAANQSLLSFRNGDTLNVGGGASANLLLFGITSGVVVNPYAGSGAPLLTTSLAGANTVTLASGVLIDGVVIGNLDARGIYGAGLTNVTIRNSTVQGGQTAIHLTDNGTLASVALSNLSLSSGTGSVLSLLGSGGGQLYVTQLADITIAGGNAASGLYAERAIFDSNLALAGIQTVVGTLDIGNAGNRVGGGGLLLDGVSGALDLDVSVFNSSAHGVYAAGGAGGFTFTLTGSIDTGPAAGSGSGLTLADLLADVRLSSLVYSGLDYGVQALDVTGVGAGGSAIDVTQLDVAAGAMAGVSIRGTSSGDFTFGTGSTIVGTTVAGVELANSGASSFSYLGSITGVTSGALVQVSDGHSGSATFSGTLSATGGTGLQFDDADGTYDFVGTTTLNGGDAGIDIVNGSGGSFSFNSSVSITNPSGIAISIADSTASLSYSGSITHSSAGNAAISIVNHAGGTLNFQSASLNVTGGNGLAFANADGTYQFGSFALSGGAGIAITTASTGGFTFGNIDVTGLTAGRTAVDLTGAAGNVSFQTLDISAVSTTGTRGIDLTGSTTAANIIVSESSAMTGLGVGVDLTNAAITGSFRYGDGSSADLDGAASSISATTPLVIAGLNGTTGTYDFSDVALTGDTSTLQTSTTMFWVQAGATGAGTRSDPGSIADAEASGANAIILIDSQAGAGLSDTITVGGDGTFALDAGQKLLSFLNGDTISLGGGAPGNVLLFGITGGAVTNPFAGSGAPVLTTVTAGAPTLQLASNTLVDGVVIANGNMGLGVAGSGALRATLRNSILSGAIGALSVDSAGMNASIALENLQLSSSSGIVASFDGSIGTLTVTALDNVTIAGGNGEGGGFYGQNLVFDADPMAAGFQTVSGTLQIGTSSARVGGDALGLDQATGGLALDLAIANTGGFGTYVFGGGGGFDFAATGSIDAILGGGGSSALALHDVDADIALTGINYSGTGTAVLLSDVTGIGAGGRAVDIDTLTVAAGAGYGIRLTGVSSGDFSFGTGSSISGTITAAIELASSGAATFTYAGGISGSTGALISIGGDNTTATFSGSLAATGGDGLIFANADGSYDFGSFALSGGARIAITSGSAGSFTFGDVDITGLTAGLTAVNLTGATGDVTFNTLDIAGASATGTRGIDLTGNAGAGDIIVTNSSTITGVGIGVDLTNASRTGAFQYGDGSSAIPNGAASSITATVPLIITGLATTGTYDFEDVSLTGDTSLLSVNAYYVQAGASGAGTRTDPGSLAGADASTAAFIVLLDTQAGAGAFDTITGTLSLADGQTLLSFRDVNSFNVGGGAPANVYLHDITTGVITNPNAGSGAPLLTSTDATGTVQLGGTNAIDGVVISNTGTGAGIYANGTAGTATIRNSTISGGGAGIDIRSGGAARIVNLQNLTLANAGNQPGALLNLNGTGGTLTLTGMSGLTIDASGVETAGLVFNTVTFDSNTATAGTQAVDAGALTIGTTGARVQGDGLSLTNVSGALTFDDLDIANQGGTGLLVANSKANGFVLTTLDGSVETSGGTAINLDPLKVSITLANIGSSASASYGILLDQVEGSFTVTGPVFITSAATAGIAIQDNTAQTVPLVATFNNGVTINNTSGAGLSFTNNAGATISFLGGGTGVDVTTTSGAGLTASGGGTISFAGSSNTIQTATGGVVNLDGVTAGAGGINFDTLNTTGVVATTAVRLNNLGGGAFSADSLFVSGLTGATSDGIWIGGGSASAVHFGSASISGGAGDEGIEINGAGNGAISFSTVSINNTGGDGVLITGSDGSVTIAGGTIGDIDDPTGNGVTVAGGSGIVAIDAEIRKNSGGRLVEITGHTGGSITFGGILNSLVGSHGVSLVGNSGAITFSGTSQTFLGTVGVDLLNNAGATINFTGGALAINTVAAGFTAAGGGTLNITGSGNSLSTGSASLNGMTVGSSGINFASVTAGNLALTNVGSAGGAVTLGTVNLTSVGSIGIDINGTFGAALSITDLDIGLAQNNAVALDLNGATLGGAITVGDFDVTNSAAVGSTIAVDLRGTTGGQTLRLGDSAVGGGSSTIAGVATGVYLNAATNANFTFGDGEAGTDTGSSISAVTPINASAAPAAGSYDFRDVNFTASPGLGFGIGKTLFVDSDGATGGGNGSGADGANPMTLAAAEAALAAGDVILLVNNGSAISAAGTNANNTLNLLANNQVRGFGNGPVVLSLTVPSVIQLASSTLTITDPGTGAATLTSSAGADVITLGASGNRISGFILDGDPAGALRGVVDNGGATGTVIDLMTIRNFDAVGGYGIEITPSTNTTIDNVSFTGNTNDVLLNAAGSTITNVTSSGATGTSITLNNATGTTTLSNVSITGAATGLSFTAAGGTVNAVNVDIAGAASSALVVSGGTANFNFDAASSITQAAGGLVLNITGNHSAGTLAYAGTINATSGAGMQFSNADGTYNFTGTTTLNGGNAGIDIYNGATGTFTFGAGTTLVHNADANSAFVLLSSANVTFDGSIADNNGRAVEIDGHDAGTAIFNGTISSSGNASNVISIVNSNGGSIVFNGETNIASSNTVVSLSDNDGGTITFNVGGNGLDIASTSGTGMLITGGGTVNVLGSGNSIATTGGTLLSITNTGATTTTANLSFASVNNGGGANGVFVQRTAGTLNGTVNIAGGAITASTRGISLNGDALNFSYGGTITATAGRSVEANGRSGGTVTLSGNIQDNANGILIASNTGGTLNFTGQTIALSTGANDAITLTNNAGATVNFAMAGGGNGLDVVASSGRGIVASGGGTITVQGAGNSIATQTGQILGLDGLTIGAAGVTFATLQSTGVGTTTAVSLNNVDGGAFAVTGTTSIAGTSGLTSDGIFIGGGSSSAVSFGATTIGATGDEGIEINGAGNGVVTFTSATINGSAGNGVEINASSNTVNINGGAIGATDDPAGRGVYIVGGTGSANIAASINKASTGAAVEVDGHQTGTVTFSGTIAATNGTGLLFTNADGVYNFTGTTTLNGGDAGIDIINGSAGALSFGDSTTITSPTGAAITVSDSTAYLNFSGDVVQANNAAALAVTNHTGGTLTFQTTGSFNVTNGTGFQFSNADGNYTISSANTLNGGDAGIDILAGSDATSGSTGSFAFITNTTITHAGAGNAFTVDSSDATVTFGGTIIDNDGFAVSINEHDGGSITFGSTSSISGSGAGALGIRVQNSNASGTITFNAVNLSTQGNAAVTLTSNTGKTINFAGGGTGLDIVTTTGAGFTATGGGTISVAGTGNTIAASGGTALNVQSTTISGTGLNFVSISANGGTNGILLSNTGTTGGLTITGDATAAANSSGGTIQNMTGDGIKLTGVTNVSFDQLNIQNTGLSGIDGTDVTNFAFTNGTINNSGTSQTAGTSNIAFNDINTGINNLDGTVTVTGSTLTNAYNSGIQIYNESGTISNINISNNVMTASGNTATSKGSGVQVDINGSTGTAAAVLAGTINNNVINDFVSGAGIQFQGGNGSLGPAVTLGTYQTTPGGGAIIQIANNDIGLSSAGTPLGTNGIAAGVTGTGQGNFSITGNEVSHFQGIGITGFGGNKANVSFVVDSNIVDATDNIANSSGIAVGSQLGGADSTQTGTVRAIISNNNVSGMEGVGILAGVTNSYNIGYFKIINNVVGSPTAAGFRSGIRVESGSSVGDATVYLEISGNTSGAVGAGMPGISLRKQGSVSGVNEFHIEGLGTAPATAAQVEAYVSAQNPGSVLGTGADGSTPSRVLSVSGDQYLNSPVPF